VLALDANTGSLLWYFQTTHHDLLDADLAGAPILFDINRNGRIIPAVAQVTKLGMVFILDRLTGEPIYGVEERPVPQSTVPGEVSWPTQPFPLKPPPLGRMSVTRDDITTTTAESRQDCLDWWDREELHNDGPYATHPADSSSVAFPGTVGGGNWGGMAFHPGLGYLFVNISNLGTVGRMEKVAGSEATGAVDYRNRTSYTRFADKNGYPCQKPPWGELAAIDANTGDFAWRVPFGIIEELEAQGVHNTGTPNAGGPMVTASGLLFIGATRDGRFRAFDAKNGKELWAVKLDAPAAASPITSRGRDGKQYVVIAAGGPSDAGKGAEGEWPQRLVAFALP
jgi:quinoprotein glucose dehydrogenase